MTEQKTLTPQEPGVIESVQAGKIQALADGTVGDLAEAIDGLGDDELDALAAAETVGRKRSTAIAAIRREQERRAQGAGPTTQVEGASNADLGDSASYRNMRGAEVDPGNIERPVLTRDGWVLPTPAAQPKV